MENNKKGGFKSREGRSEYGSNRTGGPRKSTTSGRNHFTTRRPAGATRSAERVNLGDADLENRSFGSFSEHEGSRGPRKSYGDRKPAFGDRKSSFGERKSSYGEHKSSYGDRKPAFGERKSRSYGDKPAAYGTRKPYSKFPKKEDGISRMIGRKAAAASELSDNDYVAAPIKDVVRLNKFIANSGVCSRREADDLIQAGVVTVNGEVVTELGVKVNIQTDDIRFNGERLKGEAKTYILMNKPKGYVTTAGDPHAEKTVMSLIKGVPVRVFPVGRLDKNTTGVLMFTNDGEMAEKLTHPSFNKKKIYQVILDSPLKEEDREQILSGIELSDGMISADELEYVDAVDRKKLGIEIHSGKNRIVRRIFESLGYEVRALDRVYFAGLTKKGLKKGEWRYLTEGEVNILRMGAYV